MNPTPRLRWKVPAGTSTQPPVLQQLWQGGGYTTSTGAYVRPYGSEWRDVPFVATATDEYAEGRLPE